MPELEMPEVETPEIESPETPVETPVEPQETPKTPEETPEQDGRSFAGKLREAFKKLNSSENPDDKAVAKEIKRLHFGEQAFRKEFPGGLQEVRQLKETVGKLGTPEEVESAKEAAQTLDEIDRRWMEKDPGFIDELVNLNPDSFKSLMPVALQKFAQLDPESYQREMSGIVYSTLVNSRLDTQLILISDAIQNGNKERATQLIQGIEQWMADIDKTAKSVPAKKEEQPDVLAQREQELSDREAGIFNRDLVTDFNPWRSGEIKAQLAKLRPNGKPISPERYEIFEERVAREIAKVTDPTFQGKFEALYGQKDKDGCIRLLKQETSKHLAKAVTKTYELLFGSPAKGKMPANGKPPAAPASTKPAEQGWIKVLHRPKPEEMNRARWATTDDMILQGKAILRDGRRVQWDRV